jgi:hydrogenase nickel incorporation protein HypA/HybF
MHELSIAQGIVEIAEQHLPPGSGRVTSVKVRVGELAGVVVDSLSFCFSAITTGTRLEGARLDVEHVPVTARCTGCGALSTITESEFLCGDCGGRELSIVTGRELQVSELELDDNEE